MRKNILSKEFFLSRVDIDSNGCWNWRLHKVRNGYGHVKYKNKTVRAHRLSYMFFKGDLGDLFVLHKCDNPSCVNPNHLFLGTHQDNMEDRDKKGRHGMLGKIGKLSPFSKKINQYTLDGKFIRTWEATRDIERELFFEHSYISKCCNGKYKTAYKFIWKYY